jgi:hypothetical protein
MENNLNTRGLKVLGDVIDNAMSKDTSIVLKEKHNKYKIDPNRLLVEPKIAWCELNSLTLKESILGTLGDFGLVIGKPKAKKSFFINLVITTTLSKGLVQNRLRSYLPDDQNEVAYFDTEQSQQHVQKAVKRICDQLGDPNPKNLHAYFLRTLSPQKRLEYIEEIIYSNDKLGFVVIDGIKDLVNSINDEREATMISSKLLKWTEERNIFILTVLHQNKGNDNARGHLGTELINKAQIVLSVTKLEEDSNISIVEPQQCRDKEPEPIAFSVNDDGIPEIINDFDFVRGRKANKGLNEEEKLRILRESYTLIDSHLYGSLESRFKEVHLELFNKPLGDNVSRDLIKEFKTLGWISQEKPRDPYRLTAPKNLLVN